MGRDVSELLQTEYPIPFADLLASLEEYGRWEGELVHRTKDGRAVTVASQWTLYPISPGHPQAVLEVNADITGRKVAEAAWILP